jgi:hypothetical protein
MGKQTIKVLQQASPLMAFEVDFDMLHDRTHVWCAGVSEEEVWVLACYEEEEEEGLHGVFKHAMTCMHVVVFISMMYVHGSFGMHMSCTRSLCYIGLAQWYSSSSSSSSSCYPIKP